jgi:hypothetical protein
MNELQLQQAVMAVINHLIENKQSLPKDFAEVLRDNYWELLTEPCPK